MTDSDITRNIIADCGQPQTQEMIEAHQVGCTCECCCKLSESNCQDNLDQCEEAQQPSGGGMKKMRGKLTPMMANCAVLLAVLVLSGQIARAGDIPTSEIKSDIETRIVSDSVGIVIGEIGEAASTINAIDVIDSAEIAAIDAELIGVGNAGIRSAIVLENIRIDVEKDLANRAD